MLVAGLALFLSTYLASSLTGAIMVDVSEDPQRREFGRRLLIPVAGPFMSAAIARSATGAWFTALLGVAQSTGIVLTIVGGVRLANHRKPPRYVFGGSPLPNGGQASMLVRF